MSNEALTDIGDPINPLDQIGEITPDRLYSWRDWWATLRNCIRGVGCTANDAADAFAEFCRVLNEFKDNDYYDQQIQVASEEEIIRFLFGE